MIGYDDNVVRMVVERILDGDLDILDQVHDLPEELQRPLRQKQVDRLMGIIIQVERDGRNGGMRHIQNGIIKLLDLKLLLGTF